MNNRRFRVGQPRWKTHYEEGVSESLCGIENWCQLDKRTENVDCKNCLKKLGLRK